MWGYARSLVETGRAAEALPIYLNLCERGWASGLPGATAAVELVVHARAFGFDADEAANVRAGMGRR